MNKNILLTGASGKLGGAIQNSETFENLLCPLLEEFDITHPLSINNFFKNNHFNTIIHCAAQARIALGEQDPISTLQVNIIGTANLVSAVLKHKPNTRFIHISTDGVYNSTTGYYTETGSTLPYNNYCWTKLGAECSVKLLKNHVIVRTAFFDPNNISFENAAIDRFSSKMELAELIKALKFITASDFIGTINIGDERMSDYERYKQYKSDIKSTTYKALQKDVPFRLYEDASMNLDRWKKLKESNEHKSKIKPAKIINSSSSL